MSGALRLCAAVLLVACGPQQADRAAAGSQTEAASAPPAQAGALPTGRDVPTARATPPDLAQGNREPCLVAAVSDGDSFRCAAQGRIRLLLLDAPEMDQVPFGARARDALRQRLRRGDTVWLEFDVQREDRYGRTLAHAWSAPNGGVHLNLVQARDGWAVAVVFPPNVRYIDAMRAAVADARRNRRGLWADDAFRCEPIAHKRGDC